MKVQNNSGIMFASKTIKSRKYKEVEAYYVLVGWEGDNASGQRLSIDSKREAYSYR